MLMVGLFYTLSRKENEDEPEQERMFLTKAFFFKEDQTDRIETAG